ncbi:MAG: hypothetical protein ACHQ3P_00370 [Candidatus Limnocylindrales bacterium]
MTDRRSFVLTDERLRLALLGEPPVGLADAVADALEPVVVATPQRRRGPLAWPWSPALPGLAPSTTEQRLRSVALIVALALLVSFGIGIAALAGAFHRLPPPYGIARPGLIAFDSDGTIVVAAADGSGQRRVAADPGFDVDPTFSPNGARLAYWSNTAVDRLSLMLVDPNDLLNPTTVLADIPTEIRTSDLATVAARWPAIGWSPDSSRIAYTALVDGQHQIFVADVDGSTTTQIGDPGFVGQDPAWSPDGRTIAFAGGRTVDDRGIYLMAADGSDAHRLTTSYHVFFHRPVWSPDGRWIAFETDDGASGGRNGHFVDATSGEELPVFDDAALGAGISSPTFSPDGSRIAYVVHHEGSSGDPTPNLSDRATVIAAAANGTDPTVVARGDELGVNEFVNGLAWSPDGDHLLVEFRDASRGITDRMMIVALDRSAGQPIVGDSIDGAAWQRLAP